MDEVTLLEKVRDLTMKLTPVSDMAVLLDVPELDLRLILNDRENEIAKAYRRAKAERALSIRERDIELAESGSPTAAANVALYYSKMENDE